MKRGYAFLFPMCLLFLCLATSVFGQRTTGDIEGTVKDSNGAVIPGATVTVTGVSVGFNRTVQANDAGVYRISQIPAGTYKVTTAAINGFSETTVDNIRVNIEQTTSADVVLGVSTAVNTVDVSSDPLGVNVDSTDSKVQTNITSQLIDQLPKGVSFQSILKVSPGTRPEPLSGGYQVDGASGAENTFVVDGQALENFRTGTLNANNDIPTSLVDQVQIKTSGFEAEHGGASGGVVVLATKSGNDQWRGEFGQQFELSKLQPTPGFAPAIFQDTASTPQYIYGIRSPKQSFINMFPTASLGGPIIKGRAWFYGNYSPQFFETRRNTVFYNALSPGSVTTNANQAGAGQTSNVNLTRSTVYPAAEYQSKTKYEYAFGRIDAQVFSQLRYSGTFLWNPVITEGNLPYGMISVGGTPINNRAYNGQVYTDTAFQALGGGRTNSNNTTHQLVYTPTSNLVTTFRYARAFLNEKNGNYAVPVGTRYICGGLAGAVAYGQGITGCTFGFDTGSNATAERDVSLKNEYNADVAYLAGSFFGSHQFKGGFQYGTTTNDVKSSFSGTTPINDPVFGAINLYYGRNFDAVGQSQLNSQCNLRTAANPTGNCLGYGRLYRYGNLGVASNKFMGLYIQDKWQPSSRLTLNLGVRAEKENLPAFNTGSGDATGGIPLEFGWGKKIAPRLGGAYDPFGDGKTRIWASYGLFYDRLKFELPRGSFGGNFYRVDYFPILASRPRISDYNVGNVLGNWKDPIGGGNPSTAGGLSLIQLDFRIPSNISEETAASLGLPFAGIDPDLKPYRQSEITAGVERELSSLFVLSARYTRKNLDSVTEDIGILGANGSENYIIGNPGEGFAAQLGEAEGYVKTLKPQRTYNGVEIALNKRLSSNYYFNVNYTWSRLFGNYSGLASSDEISGGVGRAAPGVTRYFDYIVNGFTFNGAPDNGLLATDRTHTFKAYGGYNFDWWGSKTNSTDLSFFQQIYQGTPQTTYMGIGDSQIVFTERGDLGRTPTLFQTDLALSHRYKFGRDDRFTIAFDVNVINAFNQRAVTGFNTNKYRTNNVIGFADIDSDYDTTHDPVNALNAILSGKFTPAMADAVLRATAGGNQINALYGQPNLYQGSRNVRFGFRFLF